MSQSFSTVTPPAALFDRHLHKPEKPDHEAVKRIGKALNRMVVAMGKL
jgi:hypothetical protein